MLKGHFLLYYLNTSHPKKEKHIVFQQFFINFQERLKIATEFGDRSAERRAHSNLGNANIFLGEFEKAAEHYKQTLLLAQVTRKRLGDWGCIYNECSINILLKPNLLFSLPFPPFFFSFFHFFSPFRRLFFISTFSFLFIIRKT